MATTHTFSWDSLQVPQNEFWKSFPYPAARNFQQCYTAEELKHIRFDSSLSSTEKIQGLLTQLQETLFAKDAAAAPKTLLEVDYPSWQSLMLGIVSMEELLGHVDKEVEILQLMVDNSPAGNLSALFNLSSVVEKRGRYKDAEEMARKVLPWIETQEMLGKDSPHALKCMRILTMAIWKQEKYAEAEKIIQEISRRVETMGTGKFAQYQAEEKECLDVTIKELDDWKLEHETSR